MSLQPWKVITTETVHETPWIRVIADRCQTNGIDLTYTYIKRVDEGATIIAETSDQKLWLVQQYRHPIRKIVWQFPSEGGHVGEDWATVAQRGLHEELGLKAQTLVPLLLVHPDPGSIQQQDHYFLARDLEPTPKAERHDHPDEIEDLRTQAFSLEEIEILIQKGEICDNWTLAGLYMYHRFLKTQK